MKLYPMTKLATRAKERRVNWIERGRCRSALTGTVRGKFYRAVMTSLRRMDWPEASSIAM